MDRQAKKKAHKRLLEWAVKKLKQHKQIEAAKVLTRKNAFQNSYSFAEALEAKGFTKLGSGCFSSVYSMPRTSKYVVKIMHKAANDGWLDYIKWAREHGYDGTFAPKIHSYKFIKTREKSYDSRPRWREDYSDTSPYGVEETPVPNGFGIAIMERLDKTVANTEENDPASMMYELFWKARKQNPLAKTILDTVRPGFYEFSVKLEEKFQDYMDLHDQNMMTRKDGSLVVTDPVANKPTNPCIRLRAA